MAARAWIAPRHEPAERPVRTARLLGRPWALALALAVPLVALYLILAPPAGDLAAATYRSDLFARTPFATWDAGWYAAHGHWLPAYSLLSPALGALLGVRVLLALSAVAASVLFGFLAPRAFGLAAGRIAAAVFAFGFCVGLLSGRVPYDIGFAIALGAALALLAGRLPLALALAVLTSVASPVAGAFLALAGVAGGVGSVVPNGLTARARAEEGCLRARARYPSKDKDDPPSCDDGSRSPTGGGGDSDSPAGGGGSGRGDDRTAAIGRRGALRSLALAVAALAPIAALDVAYPEGGYEPFAPSAFWPALAGVLLIALLLPRGPLTARGRLVVRVGAALYALALIGSFATHTPMGSNAARLGPLLAAPLLAGALWEHRRLALLSIAPALLYWQLVTPIQDLGSIASDPSVHASYYAPLLSELRDLRNGRPTIVEVPLTRAHWEAAHLPGHDGVSLARGWERQLDTRYAALFYRSALTASAYRAWLASNRVAYVALPDTHLDDAGRLEGELIERGLPYLREIWRSAHWRLYAFMG